MITLPEYLRGAGAGAPPPSRSPPPPTGSSTGAGGGSIVPDASPDQVEAPGPAERSQRRPPPGAHPTTTGYGTAATLEVAELLLRAGEGDPVAWEEILRRYSSVVFATVRTFRLQHADALDAVQMTWLRLAENSHRIQHPERLRGWLATTASRECLHILHQAKRTPTPTDTVVDNVTDPSMGPEQRVIDAETAQTLRNLVAELPPRRRTLLRALFTDHPRPYAELAASTGIPVDSIGPTRDRALCQLRQMLKDHQLAGSSTDPAETSRTAEPLDLLAALTPTQRLVLAGQRDGFTTNEIATQMNISPATVRSHLRHARERLRSAQP